MNITQLSISQLFILAEWSVKLRFQTVYFRIK